MRDALCVLRSGSKEAMTQIIRLLLIVIPSGREFAVSEEVVSCESTSLELLNYPPLRESA